MNMRYFLRSLLVCCVALSVLYSSTFSVFANEEVVNTEEPATFNQLDTSNNEYNVRYVLQYGNYEGTTFIPRKTLINNRSGSGDLNYSYTNLIRESTSEALPMSYHMQSEYVIYPTGNTKMATQGQSLSVSIDNIIASMIGIDKNGVMQRYSYFNPAGISWVDLYVYDAEFNPTLLSTSLENLKVTASGTKITIGADFDNVPFDVYGVSIAMIYDPYAVYNNNNGDTSLTSTSWGFPKIKHGWGYDNSYLTLNINDNTSALLSSIIGFIQGILDGIISIATKIGDFMSSVGGWFSELFAKIGDFMSDVADAFSTLFSKLGGWFSDLFDKIGDFMSDVADAFSTLFSKLGGWFSDLFDKIADFMSSVGSWFATLFGHIIDLPGIMWDWIENGLKKLFVPDADFIEDYKERWDDCLSDRFGALYQSVELITEYVSVIQLSSSKTTITLPSTTIDLPDGESFTFGGYNVKVIPDGFGFLADVVKLAVDMICTFFFVNALRKRFDNILGDRL